MSDSSKYGGGNFGLPGQQRLRSHLCNHLLSARTLPSFEKTYHPRYTMPRLILTPEFEADLDASEQDDPRAWDAAAVLMEDFEDHHDFPTEIPSEHYDHCPGFEVKWFAAAKNQGYEILILKFLDFGKLPTPYRIFLGYHKHRDTFYALAYRHRSTAYDESEDSLGELFCRFRECGIP